jgi:subtilisin-like proprotein convertase family protein
LTYCCEDMDLGPSTSLGSADNGSSPLFRSLAPANSPARYFPKLSSVLANTNWNQEKLPVLSRTMAFRVTVRDNRAGGGGVADADTQITVDGGTGPFVVTSPNTAVAWSASHTVTWNVAGTDGSPVNAAGVNIYLSADGGISFPYQLATNAPNNGSAAVMLPNLQTSTARIKVAAVGNIFYDISDVNFSIVPNQAFIQIASTSLVAESCPPPNGGMDPYETVTVDFTLMNVGPAAATNLVATLLATNGIYFTNQSRTYGAVAAAGGTGTQAFTFTIAGNCGESVAAVLRFADGPTSLNIVTQLFTLGVPTLSTQVFSNLDPITIPTGPSAASSYPWDISVSGITGTIVGVQATLNGLTHDYPGDVDVLLVGPGGQSLMLMSDCGEFFSFSDQTLTFDDSATTSLPFTGQIFSGTYQPTDYDVDSDFFPPPSPGGATGSTLSPLGAVPNGTWSLYVVDAYADDGGSAASWSLSLLIAQPVCCTTFPAPKFTSTSYSNNVVRLNWSTLPGPHYQVQYRTNLAHGFWQNLGSPLPGTNTALSITDTLTGGPARFYRVVAGP